MGYCGWNSASEIDRHYHDTEWGIPVHDDRKQFEYLMMEVMQCGLSWELMLRKREIFRQCFDNFDFDKVAAYDERDVERIINTDGMIRSPRKIRAIINNARCFQKIRNLWLSPRGRIFGSSRFSFTAPFRLILSSTAQNAQAGIAIQHQSSSMKRQFLTDRIIQRFFLYLHTRQKTDAYEEITAQFFLFSRFTRADPH